MPMGENKEASLLVTSASDIITEARFFFTNRSISRYSFETPKRLLLPWHSLFATRLDGAKATVGENSVRVLSIIRRDSTHSRHRNFGFPRPHRKQCHHLALLHAGLSTVPHELSMPLHLSPLFVVRFPRDLSAQAQLTAHAARAMSTQHDPLLLPRPTWPYQDSASLKRRKELSHTKLAPELKLIEITEDKIK